MPVASQISAQGVGQDVVAEGLPALAITGNETRILRPRFQHGPWRGP